ncbi:amino acid ABC transporter permease [Clostridium estertheticum]|uniref:amino acid ABC transporter permease n=1 Tax=Clostridium estertheticum TaxID=238834 RepID=UPI001C7CB5F7|nr:amino acid ABC transporter permease [Clostridium estertheticum]MBX4260956.1 amino acid ABC transporter permease [Clostridium estertheticum]MCB2340498.1 amino acid ABC transporter permease [Clostridium estertheticum]WLC71801.1 amino acid ABC transporter permease [Clostridium estertheticum]
MDILTLFKQSLPALLSGFYVTLQITIISLVIATILGLSFGMLAISRNKVLKFVATAYVDIFRGTPLIVQAFFIYFGLPAGLDIKIPPFVAGVLCISLNAGAYMVEIFRAGIMAVDKGQMEAARSLGLPYGKTMKLVILPQAISNMIPAIINQFIISLKDTSLLSVIGIRELTQSGEIIIAANFRSLETWSFVAIFYFVVIMALTYTARSVERRLKI